MTIAEELEVPCTPTASTTFRRKGKRGGVEGDQTYYLANEPAIRGKDRIDLKVDPPPDLAIEAVYSHDASPAIEIYRRLGVAEVWVCEASEVRILLLDVDRQYTESTTSGAFPVIQATDILDWISRPSDTPETQWLKAVRQWVKGTMFPRFTELSNKADTS
jgi:Uma2 family endonuclease